MIGRGPQWLWTYTVGRGSIRMPLAWYLMYVGALLLLSFLMTAVPAAWQVTRGMFTDITREAYLLIH